MATPTIYHSINQNLFHTNDGRANLQYTVNGSVMYITQTNLSAAFRHLGPDLCHAAFDYAKARNMSVTATCPYVTGYYLPQNPDRHHQLTR